MKKKVSEISAPKFPFWRIPLTSYTLDFVTAMVKDNRGDAITMLHILNIISMVMTLKEGKELLPILITRDNRLVDGLHRLTAYVLAGKEEIPVVYDQRIDEDYGKGL
jgi:hypothetical protein